jgi:indole-3-glycerol phosphate synthase
MKHYLERIIDNKTGIVKIRKKLVPIEKLIEKTSQLNPAREFKSAISAPDKINIIGELKRGSPSKGLIRKEFNITDLAGQLVKGGVSAISVLTEEANFLGSLSYLDIVHYAVNVPILRKDFIVDTYQIYESRVNHADAILLIAAVLSEQQLSEFLDLATQIGLHALVEVHDEMELAKVLNTKADIIGINNRNLDDFKVDINTTCRLRPLVPPDKTVVAESGIKTRDDMIKLKQTGVNAVLIGETLMRSENIIETLRLLV